MKRKWLLVIPLAIFVCVIFTAATASAGATTQKPKKLASIGDSITEAVDAEVYGPNHWASWANGYHGFWQWLFNLTNVNSQNQRISSLCGRRGRKNYMEAESGADSFDIETQALQALNHRATPTYVTMFIGQNDICQDNIGDITPIDDYLLNVRNGLIQLGAGLSDGSTILVVGIVDIPRLYDVASEKLALGIVNCQVLWFFTLFDLFPCSTVLSPLLEPEDRQLISAGIVQYNNALRLLVEEFDNNDPGHNYIFTDAAFDFLFNESHVSDLDCFHPSELGHRILAEETWFAVEADFQAVCP